MSENAIWHYEGHQSNATYYGTDSSENECNKVFKKPHIALFELWCKVRSQF